MDYPTKDDLYVEAPPTSPHRKTYKRETATALLAYLCGFYIWGVYEPQAAEMARFMTLPIFTFVMGAFGLDAYAKQIK